MRFICKETCALLLAAVSLRAATAHVASGPLNINGQNGTVIENLHITSTSGPCLTITNSTNITIHNSEIGPCDSSDTYSANNGQAILINGGGSVSILDSYLHAESPGIVNKTGNQTAYDVGDNILCNNSTHLTVQGNVIAWGESNIYLAGGCTDSTIRGNFFLNPISSANLGDRGQHIGTIASSRTLIDQNYGFQSYNTATYKYVPYSSDGFNMGAFPGQTNDGTTVSNNYITGGDFGYGCGIIADGGMNQSTSSAVTTFTGNTIVNFATCGISIEAGYNYVVSNNKVFNGSQITTGNTGSAANDNAFEVFQLYSYLPCANVTFSGNLGYALGLSGSVNGLYNPSQCTTSMGAGNVFDSGPNQAAYNAMNPPATKLPPPMIPPVPYSCAVVSPYTNQTAASCSGAVNPTISMTQPGANTVLSGTAQLTASPSSGVTSVSFFLDASTLLGQSTASPWSISVDSTTIANGSHSLTATASQGSVQTTSAAVPVTVQNTPAPAPPANTVTGTLNTNLWTFVDPAGGSYSISGSDLLLTAPAGSNHDPSYGGVDNAVRVMQNVGNADFTIEAKFDSIPTLQYQFEGIIAQQDASNYLRFQFGSNGGGSLVAAADSVISKVSSSVFSPAITIPSGTKSLWMRVQKAGNTWTQTWSADGKTYNTVGSFTQALTLSSIGPFAGNYSNTASAAPAFTSAVDYFNNISPSAPGPAVSDTFNVTPVPASGGLNTNVWTFVVPAGGTYSMNGSELVLTAPAGSNHDPSYGGVDNAVRVMQNVGNADFTIEAKFDSIPTLQYQFEGIIAQQDASNFLRFQFGSNGGGSLVAAADSVISKASSSVYSPAITIPSGTKSMWMRVQKSGNTWTQTWSADGKTYNTVGSFTQALTLSSIGSFAGNYSNTASAAPAFASAIDYFSNITPPAPGPPVSDAF